MVRELTPEEWFGTSGQTGKVRTDVNANPPTTTEQATEQSLRLMFSPLDLQSDLEVWLMLIAAVKLAKTSEGLKVLNNLAGKYLDNVSDIVGHLSNASASNWLTALNNEFLAVSISRRMGLISAGEAVFIHSHLGIVFERMWQKDMVRETVGPLTSLAQTVAKAAIPIP